MLLRFLAGALIAGLVCCTGSQDPIDFAKAEFLGTWKIDRYHSDLLASTSSDLLLQFGTDSFYVHDREATFAQAEAFPDSSVSIGEGLWMVKNGNIVIRMRRKKKKFAPRFSSSKDSLRLMSADGDTFQLISLR
ncbi:MAG: hypothetical protein GF398_06005 [Chitinivibrionales bacterium]|nr:hypothetical protein [Chitinivibrionales bacterium]